MTMQQKDKNNLLKPGHAVEDFFDTLLQEPVERVESLKPVQLKNNLLVLPEPGLELTHERVKHTVPFEQDLADSEKEKPDRVHETEFQHSEMESPAERQEASRYDFPIQCLMFEVAEYQLSIPMIDMASVTPWVDNLTRLPKTPDWFLGMMKYRNSNVAVVDTARLMNIEAPAGRVSNHHILVFADQPWAITCDRLGDVVELSKDDVQWSLHQGNHLTLGTIRQSLASLLDLNEILNQLNSYSDSNSKSPLS